MTVHTLSGKRQVLLGVVAHAAVVLSIVTDHFRKASEAPVEYLYAFIGTCLLIPALFYFVEWPKAFFLIPTHGDDASALPQMNVGRKIVVSAVAWTYLLSLALAWLLFSGWLPRLVSGYLFLFQIVGAVMLQKYLFPFREGQS